MDESQNCVPQSEARRPYTLNDRVRSISINPQNYGYCVQVGCQSFAIETKEKLIENLKAFLDDPSGVEEQWMKNKILK